MGETSSPPSALAVGASGETHLPIPAPHGTVSMVPASREAERAARRRPQTCAATLPTTPPRCCPPSCPPSCPPQRRTPPRRRDATPGRRPLRRAGLMRRRSGGRGQSQRGAPGGQPFPCHRQTPPPAPHPVPQPTLQASGPRANPSPVTGPRALLAGPAGPTFDYQPVCETVVLRCAAAAIPGLGPALVVPVPRARRPPPKPVAVRPALVRVPRCPRSPGPSRRSSVHYVARHGTLPAAPLAGLSRRPPPDDRGRGGEGSRSAAHSGGPQRGAGGRKAVPRI